MAQTTQALRQELVEPGSATREPLSARSALAVWLGLSVVAWGVVALVIASVV